MKVAILAPVGFLEPYSKQSQYHLTLLHLYGNSDYATFYKRRHEAGDYVILDNGANEGIEISDSDLVDTALHAGVDEVVAPDHPRDGYISSRRSIDFCLRYGETLRAADIRIQIAPQGPNATAWLLQFLWLHPFADVLGVSKKVEEFCGPTKGLSRVNLVQMIHQECFNKGMEIHLLGADARLAEVSRYHSLCQVRGIDTQKMVAAGVVGLTLNPTTKKHEFSSIDLGESLIVPAMNNAIVHRNISRFRGWAHDK